jgi:hypothetical protein
MMNDQLRALTKLAAELPGQFADAWHHSGRQNFADKGINVIDERLYDITPDELLLQIIYNQISLRHGSRVTQRLFAEFGPRPKREEGKNRLHFLAALYGANGKPPKQRFAREMADHNRRTRQRLAIEAKELHVKPWLKNSPRMLVGSGATTTKTMLQYINRMLRNKECREIVEDAYVNGFFGEGRSGD